MSDRVQFTVDRSMHNGTGQDAAAVYSDLQKAVRLDLRHHYSGPIGVKHWLSLCNSPDYGHKKLAHVIQREIRKGITVLTAATSKRDIDFVSLGPGDGDID